MKKMKIFSGKVILNQIKNSKHFSIELDKVKILFYTSTLNPTQQPR